MWEVLSSTSSKSIASFDVKFQPGEQIRFSAFSFITDHSESLVKQDPIASLAHTYDIQYNGKLVSAEKRERLLCLEYLPNGSLNEHLSGSRTLRKYVAKSSSDLDTARGLSVERRFIELMNPVETEPVERRAMKDFMESLSPATGQVQVQDDIQATSTADCAAKRARMHTSEEMQMAGGGEEGEGCVDAQLWLACAGGLCTVPHVGAAVYYFPQGHSEQATAGVDLSATRVPPSVPCRVVAVRFMADLRNDEEVFVKMRLVPLRPGETVVDVGMMRSGDNDNQAAETLSFAKTLTESDANNGGGFSIPRYCAETIFPMLDYRASPPVQTICAKDMSGVVWKFRHIYRGTPRRHLLTTGWSTFVNQKKLVAGDSIVFHLGEDGKIHVGIRRAIRGGAHSIPVEDVLRAARLAAAGQPFEVVHYPWARSPEFFVHAAKVREAMQVRWCPGMRVKMAFQMAHMSQVSWFMGTISGVQAADPARWPQSPWRLLQVTWDEPGLLGNVKRVCPWQVETGAINHLDYRRLKLDIV
ncbi:hypothetical protein PR202_ga15141 [Eleusine coracana subsp. coracana]|uniref:Auxin response factor n=1 Tax=Eleusine coracana subsp. coracana TaxID=191504 RepID=A0AAV5CJD2_ELECO|nr:hypothetical protein PR202_ga15141 [Eleusine coracana subsp. coracana]